MTDHLLLYGASGFTGRLILQNLQAFGLRPILGGRNRDKLAKLAAPDTLPVRIARLTDEGSVRAMLEGVDVVLNAAGPFKVTAPPLVAACLEERVHYLDVSGEFAMFEQLARLDERARERGIMILPGVGFDIVVIDCMAAEVHNKLPEAKSLTIALAGLDAISRGSAESVFAQYRELVTVRREGRLVRVQPGELNAEFDFGDGSRPATAITWADVASAYYSTGIPNITVYYEATPIVRMGLNMNRYASWMMDTPVWEFFRRTGVSMLREGPSAEERAAGSARVVVRAEDDSGAVAEACVRTPEVYSFTGATAALIADRVLGGAVRTGFQTPSKLLSEKFVTTLPGVERLRG